MTKQTKKNDLIVEIGLEDLPAKGLATLSQNFAERIAFFLQKEELPYTEIKSFVTPRRLAVFVSELAPTQADRLIQKRGPAKNIAFDENGKPSNVALGFAKSCGVSVDTLSVQETPKGSFLMFEQKEAGKSTEEILPSIVERALDTLPLPIHMRWTDGEHRFIRPLHWVLLMLGDKIIKASFLGCESGAGSEGHRFHHPESIRLASPSEYQDKLFKPGKVIVDFEKRKEEIRKQIHKVCEQNNCVPLIDEKLLEEVTGLVEWPCVLLGKFDPAFLELPQEVLITAMQVHQKCFGVSDKNQKLLPYFLITSNIESSDPECVITGNERVIHARLADAAFYYKVDQEKTLAERAKELSHVVFQKGLGSLAEKCERLAAIAQEIAKTIGNNRESAARAAMLCKADLLTQMVYEFPELQGVIGKYYALHNGESASIANAIEEHYLPRFAEDKLPESKEGIALALADRIDNLLGMFSLGKQPTGDKDPYSLRRQALAMMRIIIEKELDLDLKEIMELAKNQYDESEVFLSSKSYSEKLENQNLAEPSKFQGFSHTDKLLFDFCFERLRTWYQAQNIPLKVFDAVWEQELRPSRPYDFHLRLLAINLFKDLPEAESLAAANKRVKNILSKSAPEQGNALVQATPVSAVDETLLKEPAEKDLYAAIKEIDHEVKTDIKNSEYISALRKLATLKTPVDTFFDKVMVMTEDKDLQKNRLKLLHYLRSLFLQIADISLL